MNWKTWIPLVLALVLGLVAAKAGRDILLRNRAANPAQATTAKIVVAKRDLAPGQTIQDHDIATASVPAERATNGSFRNQADVVGRVLMQGLVKEQAVTEIALAPLGSTGGPQALVPTGMRAVTVEVNESSGVAGLLVPGCHVDIVSTLQDASDATLIARTIVQNVKILAVGQRLMTSKPDDGDAALSKSATLIVTPQQAEAIELASRSGRMRLVLRGLMDDAPGASAGVTIADLLGTTRATKGGFMTSMIASATKPPTARPTPAATPTASEKPQIAVKHRTIEVISGNEVSKVQFELPPDTANNVFTGNGVEPVIPGSRAP